MQWTFKSGLVVVDEIHMIGKRTRECDLKNLLCNLIVQAAVSRIVAMSATIGNIQLGANS